MGFARLNPSYVLTLYELQDAAPADDAGLSDDRAGADEEGE